jgi:hypothetical protein
MKKASLALLALITLVGCGAPTPEATVIITEIVSTKAPAVEQVREVTAISVPTDKPSPSPTVPTGPQLPTAFMDTARDYCDNAFIPDPAHTWDSKIQSPAVTLINIEYEQGMWAPSEFIPIPEQIDKTQTLICILQTRLNKGTYIPIGGTAFQLQWDIWLVSWPEGALLGSKTIMGGDPPQTKTGTGSRYGKSPADEALAWVEAALSEPLASLDVSLYSLAYIPETETLLTNTRGSFYALDAEGEQQSSFEVSDPGAYRMVFSPDGRLTAAAICTQIEEGTCIAAELEVRAVETGERIFTLRGDPEYNWILSLAFSPDSRTLISGHSGNIERTTREQIWRWDMQTGRGTVLVEGEVGHVYALRIAPDGNTFAANLNVGVRLYDLQTGEQVSVTERKGNWPFFEFSPDGNTLAVAYCEATEGPRCALGGIMLWDLTAETEIASWPSGESSIQSMAFSPDGATLASAACSQTRLLITEDGEPIQPCTAVDISLWSTVDSALLGTFDAHLAGVPGLAFSPDGTHLYSASYDGTIRVWELK